MDFVFALHRIFLCTNLTMKDLQGEKLSMDQQRSLLIGLRQELMKMSGVGFYNDALFEVTCPIYTKSKFFITHLNAENVLTVTRQCE